MLHRPVHRFRSSMSAKIALIVVVPAVLMVFFFSARHYAFERSTILRNAETTLLQVGENLKVPAETFLRTRDSSRLQAFLMREILNADIAFAAVYDSEGKVVASNKREWLGRKTADMQPRQLTAVDVDAVRKAFGGGYSSYYDVEDSESVLVMPIFAGDPRPGALFISLNLTATNAQIRQRAIEVFLVALGGTVIFGVSTYFLFHVLLIRRVRAVSTAALQLAAGDATARARVPGTDEISYLATSFNLLAEEIANWRSNLEEMANSRMSELLMLFDIVNTTSQSLDLNAVLPNVLDSVISRMNTTRGVIVLLKGDENALTIAAQRGLSEESLCQIIESGQGCVGDVILRNKSMRLNAGEEEGPAVIAGLEQDHILSALVVPISARGTVLGAVAVYSGKRETFSENDEALLATIGNQLSVAVLNAQLYEKTLDLAQKDGLTGLFNRRHLMERLQSEMDRAARYHTALSLIILDLDKFKSFNDTYGHVKGDELLKGFAKMVAGSIRTTDVAGRYGGEEFCVILPNTPISGGAAIAERIRRGMEGLKIEIGDGKPADGRTVSIGIAEFSGKQTVEQLVALADLSLYRAKEGGRNRVVW